MNYFPFALPYHIYSSTSGKKAKTTPASKTGLCKSYDRVLLTFNTVIRCQAGTYSEAYLAVKGRIPILTLLTYGLLTFFYLMLYPVQSERQVLQLKVCVSAS